MTVIFGINEVPIDTIWPHVWWNNNAYADKVYVISTGLICPTVTVIQPS